GAQLRIPGGARAALSANELRVHLLGDTSGRVGHPETVEGHSRYELGLDSGEAVVELAGATQLAAAQGKERVTLKGLEPSSAFLSAGPDGVQVQVRAGSVELASAHGTLQLKAG